MRAKDGNRDVAEDLIRLGSAGILALPMAFLLLAVLVGGLGTVGLMRQWRETARLQLTLDECVRARVLHMRENLQAVERGNRRMRALRAVIAASSLKPSVGVAARRLLSAVAGMQKLYFVRWQARRAKWLLFRCGEGAMVLPQPGFPWRVPPPDILGPRPLEWVGPDHECFKVLAFKKPRSSAAELSRRSGTWAGGWIRPRKTLSAGCEDGSTERKSQ